MKNDDFLRAIIANPDDDAPRLIYADWLDEHGDSARAEFIRLQIALARMDADDLAATALRQRTHELERQHGDAWRGELPVLPEHIKWDGLERGFPNSVTAESMANLVAAVATAVVVIPLEQLTLCVTAIEQADLRVVARLVRLREIRVFEEASEDVAVPAVESTLASLFTPTQPFDVQNVKLATNLSVAALHCVVEANLPKIRQFSALIESEETALHEVLLHAAWLTQLESLHLEWRSNDTTWLARLGVRLNSKRLRILDLGDIQLDEEAVAVLVGAGLLQTLRKLSFRVVHGTIAAWQSLLAACPPTLRLHVGTLNLGDAGLVALAQSPVLAQMTELPDFGSLTDVGVRALAATTYGTRLEHLRLNAALSSEGLAALFTSAAFPLLQVCHLSVQATEPLTLPAYRHSTLRRFEIDSMLMNAIAFDTFFAASDLPALEVLTLFDLNLGPDTAAVLANASGFPKLRELLLSDNPLGDEGLIALLSGVGLPALADLCLWHCGLTVGVLQAWRQSPRLAQLKRLSTDQESEGDWPDEESYAEYLSFRDYAWSLGCSVDGWTGASP